MLSIKLSDDRWIRTQHGHVLGSAFVKDNLYDAEAIDAYLYDTPENQLSDKLHELNGRWSVCLKLSSGDMLVSTDRIRTWPLFYSQGTRDFFLSDKAEEIRAAAGDTKPDPVACEELLHTYCVTGHDTLFPHVKQLLGGEMLLVRGKGSRQSVKALRWYAFKPQEPAKEFSCEEYLTQLDALMLRAHQRLIDYANGRPIFIPLSGGMDSRSVAATLVRLKYDNLHSYCYGDPSASDTLISRDVAQKLHIKWHHIPYSKKMWREEFQKPYFQNYLRAYHQYTVVPNIQEIPAARILTATGILPKDAVIVPGHSDGYMGSQTLPPDINVCNKHQLLDVIIKKKYFSSMPLSDNVDWHARIDTALGTPLQCRTPFEANALFEQWHIQETASKYTGSFTFPHVFFKSRLYYPLCDNDLLDFWEQVPQHLRFNRNLQQAYVQKYYALACGEAPTQPVKTDRDRSTPQEPRVILKKWRGLIPPLLKYLKRHRLLAQNKWGWHYAFPFSYRHACIKKGNLSIDYFVGKYILENFVYNKEK